MKNIASCIQLNHQFHLIHYFSFRIKQEFLIANSYISLFVSILFHFYADITVIGA